MIPPSQNPGNACGICLTAFDGQISSFACPQCGTDYHSDCWEENGGCGVYGCMAGPIPEPRQALEIPASHWGQEHKHCPSCGSQIQAAAVRCRYCGITFSATPLAAAAFRRHRQQSDRLPTVKRSATLIGILCLFPFSAPLGLLIGAIWLPLNWRDLASVPSLYRTLVFVGLAVALIVTLGIVVLTQIYRFSDTAQLVVI